MLASKCLSWSVRTATAVVAVGSLGFSAAANPQGLVSSDLSRLRSVGGVAASPDGKRVAYTVVMRDRPGRPYDQLWIMDLSTQKSVRVGGEKDSGGSGVWSPDGKWIAFSGHQGDKGGLFVVRLDGSEVTFLAEAHGTNSPLPGMGNEISWSPDSKQIAFVSSTPGPRAAEASGDPMVITRYLYKPDAGEGMTRFNDNQRLHIFVVDAATKQVRQLTQGDFDEHSVDWSPDGKKILFGSNREPNQDEFFTYDLFTLNVADGSIQRLTATEYNEYDPIWSPDGKWIAYRGTRRGITDRETTMEDTHDSSALYFTVQERGNNVLMRLPVSASAGVAPSKFLAKLASDWRKPDGLFVIQPEDIDSFLLPLPVGRLPGVGKVTGDKLAKLGIQAVGDLRKLELSLLEKHFGRYGLRLHELARGVDDSAVVPDRPTKSISVEDTFEQDVLLAETEPMIRHLAEKLWSASRKESRLARTVVLKLKTSGFKILTRSHTPDFPPSSCEELTDVILKLREKVDLGPHERYRLVGVGLSNFREAEQAAAQPPLFECRAVAFRLWHHCPAI